jgi:arginase
MNAEHVERVARAVADRVSRALGNGASVLVLGGDCTVELGSVAGASSSGEEVGLVYVDLDTDLNTPMSVSDGALDWMGLAHLVGLPNTLARLRTLGGQTPLLRADQIHLFANDNSTEFERSIIDERGIAETRLAAVVADPAAAGRDVATN